MKRRVPCPVRYNANTSASFLETSLGSSDWDASLAAERLFPTARRKERMGDGGRCSALQRSRSAPGRGSVRQLLEETSAQGSLNIVWM